MRDTASLSRHGRDRLVACRRGTLNEQHFSLPYSRVPGLRTPPGLETERSARPKQTTQSADLCSESRFVVHFRISKDPKMEPRGDHVTLLSRTRFGADPAPNDPPKTIPSCIFIDFEPIRDRFLVIWG